MAGSTSTPISTRLRPLCSRRTSTACHRSFRAGKSAACSSAAARVTRRGYWRHRSRLPNHCARVANEHAPASVRFLINGEPTDNRLGAATRGIVRVRLHADGRAAHSSFPELGESAIDKLLDALMVLRGVTLPDDPL